MDTRSIFAGKVTSSGSLECVTPSVPKRIVLSPMCAYSGMASFHVSGTPERVSCPLMWVLPSGVASTEAWKLYCGISVPYILIEEPVHFVVTVEIHGASHVFFHDPFEIFS